MMTHTRRLALVFVIALVSALPSAWAEPEPRSDAAVEHFLNLLVDRQTDVREDVAYIEKNWHPGFAPMVLEVIHLSREPFLVGRLVQLLQEKTGQSHGYDIDAWYQWLWSEPENRYEFYPDFKATLYRLIDERFAGYFNHERKSEIRLDEVRWGGVLQDGIPPLRSPEMIAASEANYLADDNVVFGIELNGDARAYPKRILAWHEMFVDKVGGEDVAGVYCTLCGTVILYKTLHEGTLHKLGTSGFLYRSNKLMYDKATQTLWNTLWGRPTIGPLVGKDIELERGYLVTTNWGEWKRRHPSTTVLSLNTGHRRDYGEGVAYRDYFATDELMFTVPEIDARLKNKDEVLALWFPTVSDETLAIAADYLAKHPVYHDRIGERRFVVLTDLSGANRVYETDGVEFKQYDGDAKAVDSEGGSWSLSEDKLVAGERQLHRLPAHRAFWFGWYSAFNRTRLVH